MHEIDVQCPYCESLTAVEQPRDFAGHYANCLRCGESFILERTAQGCRTWTRHEAPCCSDPDCRESEMAQGDEE